MKLKNNLLFIFSIACVAINAQVKLNINADQRGIDISPTHYGLFFEDINHAADGGLYAELIQNRSFEDNTTADHWSLAATNSSASMALVTSNLLNSAQQKALKLTATSASSASPVSITNEGFWGINAVQGRTYKLSFWAKADQSYTGSIKVGLESTDKLKVYGSSTITGELTTEWKKFTATIISNANDGSACFFLNVDAPVTLYLDVVSLFPPTFNDRNNGCRPELAQLLKDMSPKFLRFPGGCFVEGNSEASTYKWKNTVGSIEQRAGHQNQWGYRTSDGMGYQEFLQLCEDIGAAPLYVVNVGIWHGGYAPYNNIDEYVQDAVDAIEYANGDATTTYGAMRVANGHPEPFNLSFIEVGNENYQANSSQQSDNYAERYIQFYNAIKEKYPTIKIIGNVEAWGTDNPTWRNNYPVDLLDEHYYRNPSWFQSKYNKYDSYSRTGPKIYAGEYAVTSDCGNGNLNAALGEAVYMLGMENNSDVVTMNSYAPIFKNENTNDWAIDMIHFNSKDYYCTPSYYVQKLFPNNIGTKLVPWTQEENTSSSNSKFGLGTWSTVSNFDDFQVLDTLGNVIMSDDFSAASTWAPAIGTWNVTGGVYSQSTTATNCTSIFTQSTSLENYVYKVRAYKKSGDEGFLIIFNYKDANNYCWWNLGGWGNTAHAIEQCTNGTKSTIASVSGSLASNQWYDIRIEVKGIMVRCYLNNALIHTATLSRVKNVYSSVSIDEKTKELIVKMVNPSVNATNVQVNIKGKSTIFSGTVTVLSSANGTDENSMTSPTNIVPTAGSITIENDTTATIAIPAYSVNIVRLKLNDGTGIASTFQNKPLVLLTQKGGFTLSTESNDSCKVEIFTMDGKLQKSIQNLQNKSTVSLNPGLYIVKVYQNGEITSCKVDIN